MRTTWMLEAVLKVFPQLCPAASSQPASKPASSSTKEGYPRRVQVKRVHVLVVVINLI